MLTTLLLAAVMTTQTNPCASSTTTEMLAPNTPATIYAELPEHNTNEADGLPRITDYQLAYFAATTSTTASATATPVIAPVTIPKTSLTPVSGAANCYSAQITPVVWTGSWPLVAGLKARRAARSGVNAAESDYRLSNPFAMVPAALATPGQLLIRQK